MTDTAAVADTVDSRDLLAMYEQMVVIRRTEKAAYDLFMSGKVKGTRPPRQRCRRAGPATHRARSWL